MNRYLERARAALRNLVGAPPYAARPGAADTPPRSDESVAAVTLDRAATEPASWLDAFEAAVAQHKPVSNETLAFIKGRVGRHSADTFFPSEREGSRLVEFLRLRAGLSAGLTAMGDCGLLQAMFPEIRRAADGLAAIRTLERLLDQTATLSGERFGLMIRELGAPELLVLSLLLHSAGPSERDPAPEESVRAAAAALDRVRLTGEARQDVEFLLRLRLQMRQLALRGDTADPDVIGRFAALCGTEERLKMLCLMTIADLSASGPDALSPWKEELLWRLYVDTYNRMTVAYGDEVIDRAEATLTALQGSRPADISEDELKRFLEGLPRRYLGLFDAESIYEHVRLWRDIRPDTVHFFLNQKPDAWELAVVTLDKPYLFSNICGVLAFCGMDILRGYALTSLGSLVVDVFQFADRGGFFERGPESRDARAEFDTLLADVVAGRVDITARLAERARPHDAPRTPPVIYFDNDSSHRYTVLEVVTDDAPGLLHRISRVISSRGCAVDLVLISTEGHKAVDVFHMRKGTVKLTDSDQLALTEDLERMLEAG